MGAVDVHDAKVEVYSVLRRTLEAWLTIFLYLIECVSVNSWVLWEKNALAQGKNPPSQKLFLEDLLRGLYAMGAHPECAPAKRKADGPPAGAQPIKRIGNKGPFIHDHCRLKKRAGGFCVYCKKKKAIVGVHTLQSASVHHVLHDLPHCQQNSDWLTGMRVLCVISGNFFWFWGFRTRFFAITPVLGGFLVGKKT